MSEQISRAEQPVGKWNETPSSGASENSPICSVGWPTPATPAARSCCGWLINGSPFNPALSAADPRLGDIEIWRFRSDLHHPVHVHLDPFQVISRRGEAPGPYDAGWKDTVDIRPSETVEVAVRFTEYPGRYLVHCHNLEHEDMAMMATFRTQ